MPGFVRDGVRLHWQEAGDTAGFPLVLHTGGAGDGSMWRDGYVEPLAGFRLLLLDHRGRGRSDRPQSIEAHRIEQYVRDAAALADAAGLDRYGFMGYSFGGAVGLLLAARDPRLSGLVALGAVYDPPGTAPPSVYTEPTGTGMQGLVDAVEQEEALTLPDALRRQFLDTDGCQFQLTLAAAEPDAWQLLAEITAAVVLIAGGDEDPEDTQGRMAALIPSARSVHLPGAGHVGAFLRSDEVVAEALPLLRAAAG